MRLSGSFLVIKTLKPQRKNSMFKGNVKKVSARLALVPAAVLASLGTAHAALPEDVTTAITAAKTDIGEAGALGIGVFLAIMIFIWLRRVMK